MGLKDRIERLEQQADMEHPEPREVNLVLCDGQDHDCLHEEDYSQWLTYDDDVQQGCANVTFRVLDPGREAEARAARS